MTGTRQRAHQSIDRLPETIVNPVSSALRNAPLENERETDEEAHAIAEAGDWLNRNGGKGIPHAEAMRRLGIE